MASRRRYCPPGLLRAITAPWRIIEVAAGCAGVLRGLKLVMDGNERRRRECSRYSRGSLVGGGSNCSSQRGCALACWYKLQVEEAHDKHTPTAYFQGKDGTVKSESYGDRIQQELNYGRKEMVQSTGLCEVRRELHRKSDVVALRQADRRTGNSSAAYRHFLPLCSKMLRRVRYVGE